MAKIDIWMKQCRRSTKCSYCGEMIDKDEPLVFGKLWRKMIGDKSEVRRWVKKFHWHAKRKRDSQCCWQVQGLEWIAKTPYMETRGRKKLVLPKDIREQRRLVMLRRGRVVQRLKAEMETGPYNMDKVIALGERLEKLRIEIEPMGGVPKSWV